MNKLLPPNITKCIYLIEGNFQDLFPQMTDYNIKSSLVIGPVRNSVLYIYVLKVLIKITIYDVCVLSFFIFDRKMIIMNVQRLIYHFYDLSIMCQCTSLPGYILWSPYRWYDCIVHVLICNIVRTVVLYANIVHIVLCGCIKETVLDISIMAICIYTYVK